MTSVRNIVKVMNFHSLIRVDKAKREANKYFDVEKDLTNLLYSIVNNKNLRLDKKMYVENPDGIVLNIYIGNDLGFCGNFNQQLHSAILSDNDAYKIIIGKKLLNIEDDKTLLKIEKDCFFDEYPKIEALIKDYIINKKIKEINIVFNYYHTVSEITFERVKVFPIDIDSFKDKVGEVNLEADYVIETDIDEIITSIIVLYICYQVKVYESNSWASENIMRERVTRESIKKIDEREEEKTRQEKKEKKDKNFKKQINNQRGLLKGRK